jgi:hypothetical protein
MIAYAIRFVLHNLPALLFVAALAIAAAQRGREPAAERFLSWLLLLYLRAGAGPEPDNVKVYRAKIPFDSRSRYSRVNLPC